MKPFISFCLLLCICLGKLYAQGVNIVYIGNSITQGALLKTTGNGGAAGTGKSIHRTSNQAIGRFSKLWSKRNDYSGFSSNRRKTISECKICRPRIEST